MKRKVVLKLMAGIVAGSMMICGLGGCAAKTDEIVIGETLASTAASGTEISADTMHRKCLPTETLPVNIRRAEAV